MAQRRIKVTTQPALAAVPENTLPLATSLTASDKVRVVTVSGESKSILYSKLNLGGASIPCSTKGRTTKAAFGGIPKNTTFSDDELPCQIIEKALFPFEPATIGINGGTSYYEIGTKVDINLTVSLNKKDETLLSNGNVTGGTSPISFAPTHGSHNVVDKDVIKTTTYKASVHTDNNGSPKVITSHSSHIVKFIYATFKGISATKDFT